MANTTQPLTNTQVDRSKPRDSEYKLGDGHGLFLAIKPSGKKTSVSPNYAEDIWCSLELHIFPSIGGLPIDRITAPLVIKAIKQLESQGSLETVKRLCQRVNEIMIFATNTGITTSNPLTGISIAFPKPGKAFLPAIC